ncbi:oligosaccharide flippase family protein [Geobacter pickeringii]|uniref:oligosaccharide flippase family protein n=1 Tax=Geobacter pickeringii TaxID=345632 RepID=UPI0009FF8105|nr:oligosaccharide flippase family protein [Geobacter pickeringii]
MLKKLIINSSSNILTMVVKVVCSFIMTPVIVKALGNYDYGLWEIVFALVGYMGLLDIGMRPAVVRYVAKYEAVGDKKSINELFSTAITFSLLIGIFGCLILVVWGVINPNILSENNKESVKYLYFLVIIGCQLFVQFPGLIAECVHAGYQRYNLYNNITIINTLIGNSIVYVLLKNGHGLVTLALGNAIGVTVKYLIYLILLLTDKYGGIRWKARYISIPMLKKLLNFGGKSFVTALSTTAISNSSSLIIGIYCNPAMIPFYSIPKRLISYLNDMSNTITNVFMPTFSQLYALRDVNAMRRMYLASTKYIIGVTYPLIIGISILGNPFLKIWMGQVYAEKSQKVLILLAIGNIFYLMNPLLSQLLTGINKIRFLIITRGVTAVMVIVLSLIFVRNFSYEGVASAFLITSVSVKPVEIWYTSKVLKVTIIEYTKTIYLPMLLPNFVLFLYLKTIVNSYKITCYADIAYIVSCGICVYALLFIFFSFNKDEKNYLRYKLDKAMAR